MPVRGAFAPEARAHLLSIYTYIAEAADPEIAFTFTAAIVDYCESFTTFPHRGTRREDLRPGLRTIGFRRRVTIAFAVDGETVNIIGIFYGGRNMDDALRGETEE